MIPRIRELLHAAPFQPFAIRTSDGREYIVPTADHVAVNPKATRVIVFSDDDGQVEVTDLHVAAVLRNGKVEKETSIAETSEPLVRLRWTNG